MNNIVPLFSRISPHVRCPSVNKKKRIANRTSVYCYFAASVGIRALSYPNILVEETY